MGVGTAVGVSVGRGVLVGKKAAVGGTGWKGVGVGVAFGGA